MRLLWVDDDGQERFSFEELVLTEKGWDIEWALDVLEAAEKLGVTPYDAILLDQTLPVKSQTGVNKGDVWAGCLLLYWLRGKSIPGQVPFIDDRDKLERIAFPQINSQTRVIVVSAFYDTEVSDVMRDLEPELQAIIKPINIDHLLVALNHHS